MSKFKSARKRTPVGFFKPVIVCKRFPALRSTISKVLFPSATKKSRCVSGSAAAWSNRPSTLSNGMDIFSARGGGSSAKSGQTSQSTTRKPSVCFIEWADQGGLFSAGSNRLFAPLLNQSVERFMNDGDCVEFPCLCQNLRWRHEDVRVRSFHRSAVFSWA